MRPLGSFNLFAECTMKTLALSLLAVSLAGTALAQSPASKSDTSAKASPPAASTTTKPAADNVIVAVNLPQSGSYLLLTEDPAHPGKALAPPVSVNGPKAALELPATVKAKGKIALSALDSTAQLLAKKTVSVGSGAASVTFAKADFDRVASLPVQVTSGGKAVSTALVTLTGPDNAVIGEEQLLPGQGGVVTFKGVPAGKNTVKVVYDDGQTATQEVTVDLTTPAAQRSAEVTVAGAKATEALKSPPTPAATPKPSPAAKEAKPASPAPTSSPMDGFIGFLTALAILGLVGYGGYVYFKSHPDKLQAILGKLPLPEEAELAPEPLRPAEPPPVQVPPGTCEFCGEKKDPATGECACSLTPGSTAFSPKPFSAQAGPRLVSVAGPLSGQSFPLNGSVSLGREAGNDVPLIGDQMASRRHAQVIGSSGAYVLRDEGSSNGTFLNGARITEATLHSGDELTIGQSRFRFEQ
jgi:hypothetical protein